MNNIIEATILNGKFKGKDVLLPTDVFTYKYMIGKNTVMFK